MAKTRPTPRVCIDSSVVIAYLNGDQPQHTDGIASLFHDARAKRVQLLGSTLLLAEVMGGGYDATPDLAMDNRIFGILRNPETITLIQASLQVGMIARDLRRELRLKTPDAIHVASAIFAGVDAFMTTDERLPVGKVIKGVPVRFPESPSGNLVLPSSGPSQ